MTDTPSSSNASGDVSSLRFRPMERTEEDLRLFQRAFVENESPRSLELLRWQYFEPPDGRLYVDFAVTGDDEPFIAAIYAVFPVSMRVAGARTTGSQSLNTLTDVRYRGKGLFVRMANAVYERCARDGVAIVYGFPNGSSAHGIFKKLHWSSFDPMPLLLRPLRLGYVVSRLTRGKISLPRWLDVPLVRPRVALPAGWTLRTVTEFGPQFDELWRKFAEGIAFAVERDSAYLRWRLRRPGSSYETVALFAEGEMAGYVITGHEEGRGGRIMDLIYDPARSEAGGILMREAIRRLFAAGCGAIWAYNFDHSQNHEEFRRAGFVHLTGRFNVEETHSGARSLVTPPQAVSDRTQWYFSMLDSDTS
jgi:GNAT superfamily N-acetyltransferase